MAASASTHLVQAMRTDARRVAFGYAPTYLLDATVPVSALP